MTAYELLQVGGPSREVCRIYTNSYGYQLTRHPTQRRLIQVHRLVLERKLGRPLLTSEVVHHRNGIRADNRFSNLELLDGTSHDKAHGRSRTATTCPTCGEVFTAKSSKYRTYCSNYCFTQRKRVAV